MTLYIYYVPDAVLDASYAIRLESLSPYEVGPAISPDFTSGESEAWRGYSPCVYDPTAIFVMYVSKCFHDLSVNSR